jgi:hypothetical protein
MGCPEASCNSTQKSELPITIAYDTADRVSQVTAIPSCPTGLNCQSQQSTLSRYNGHNQRFLRQTDQGQTVFV